MLFLLVIRKGYRLAEEGGLYAASDVSVCGSIIPPCWSVKSYTVWVIKDNIMFLNGWIMTKRNYTTTVFCKRSARLFIAGLALMVSQGTYATLSLESASFTHKDWDLICDNTLTCRAAGYSSGDTDPAATVLLIRDAGPATPVSNQVMLADYDGETASKNPGVPLLIIDNHSLGKLLAVDGDAWRMSHSQFTAFMQALRRDSKIIFKDNVNEYIFSGSGSSAVLLKMDDVQGRVGTTGALMKKGGNSESGVKIPVPQPVIIKAPVRDKQSRDMTLQETVLIKPLLMELVGSVTECDKERINGTWQIAGLNEKLSLVIAPCWMAAYNSGDVHFVISNDMSSPPVMVTDSGTSYDDGIVDFSMKGRGLGDCWSYEEWVWNGKRFEPSAAGNTGRCRLIRPGGAWSMPILKTNVVTE